MSPGYGYGLHQQQTAGYRMTPRLRQAIRILQLSTPELMELVREELQDNPILETMDGHEFGSPSHSRAYAFLEAADCRPSLELHLREQLSFIDNKIPHALKRIVLYMIGNLDGNGYLEPSLEEIADELQTSRENAELALRILQGFEPTGIGARNLRECLLLQIKELPHCSPLVPLLITSYLEDIAYRRVRKLAKALAVSEQEVKDAMKWIRSVNPRPGAAFQPHEVKYIIPDLNIRRVGEQFVVSINEAAFPRLTINTQYERMAERTEFTAEASHFLNDKKNSAVFLLKCLEQRRLTLLRVTQAIVNEQDEFFRQGFAYLKPMVLRQIADKLSVHESTVSRATAGKFAQTPWGTFELTFFFPSGFHTDGEQTASSETVKERIKEWIRKEDKGKPYSDKKLADILLSEGVDISRRTVMKYREQLGIESSVRRKRI